MVQHLLCILYMVIASGNISADLLDKPVALTGSKGTKGGTGLADMLFMANVSLVNGSVAEQRTNPVSSSETVNFFDLLVGEVVAGSKKTADTSAILPVQGVEQIIEAAIVGQVTAKDFDVSLDIPGINDSTSQNDMTQIEVAVSDLAINQQLTRVIPATMSVSTPEITDQSSILPDITAGVSESQGQDLFVAGTDIANGIVKNSNIVEQLNESDVSIKLPVNQTELSDKIVDDAGQKLDFDAKVLLKQTADPNDDQGTRPDVYLSDKPKQGNKQFHVEPSPALTKESTTEHVSGFTPSVRPESPGEFTVNSTIGTEIEFNPVNVKVGPDDVQTDEILTDSIVTGNGQFIEKNDIFTPPSPNKSEMLTSQVASKQITDSIRSSVVTDDRQIHIRLNPQQLGEIRISFKSQQDCITGIIEVSKPELKPLIQSMLPGLINDIQDSGVNVKKMTVSDGLFQQQFAGNGQQPSGRQSEQAQQRHDLPQYQQAQSGLDILSSRYNSSTQSRNQVYSDSEINILV